MAVDARHAAARAAGPLGLCLLFAGLVAWSFRRWADPQIDFGNELYIAWRVSEGDVLYRDLAQRNGPLSHAWNGLLFRWFGVSIDTLVAANLAVLAGIAALLWRLLARACDRATATLCGAVLLCVFAFGQYGVIGNFNYVTPYHHFQTHGLVLSLAMIACLDAAARSRSPGWPLAAGACLGAVFLTKAELFVPAAAAAATALALRALGAVPGSPWRMAAWGLGGALAPLVVFGVWLGSAMPPDRALAGLLGNWMHLQGLAGDAFYRSGAGLDDPLGNLLAIGRTSAAIALVVGGVAAFDRVLYTRLRGPGARAALAGAAFSALLLAGIPWWHASVALPVVALVAAAWAAARLRREDPRHGAPRSQPLLLLAVLGGALLGKMALSARFDWYGFVLAMPATLVGIAALVHGLPAWLGRRWEGGGGVARALAIAAVAAASVSFLAVSQRAYAQRDFAIGRGGDTILARGPQQRGRAPVLARTLALLEQRVAPGETLLVLPEGAILNYWLRARSPSRFLLFLPTELRAFGEERMLAELRADPPDHVVLAHRLGREFGVGWFGEDPRNGEALRAWVDANYRRVQRFGAEPFRGQGFGTVVLERTDRAPSAPR